jgi:hypothetical protein
MNVEIIEHRQQWVLDAFRQGEFDQIEVIGEADEKEFFELCFKEKRFLEFVDGVAFIRLQNTMAMSQNPKRYRAPVPCCHRTPRRCANDHSCWNNR